MSKAEIVRKRRPAARHYQVVIAAIDERMLVLAKCTTPDSLSEHTARVRELLDELQRALGRKDSDTE